MAISPIVTQIYNDLSYKEEDVDVILLELYLWDENQKKIQSTLTRGIYPDIYSLLDFNIYFENYRIMYNYLVMALKLMHGGPPYFAGGMREGGLTKRRTKEAENNNGRSGGGRKKGQQREKNFRQTLKKKVDYWGKDKIRQVLIKDVEEVLRRGADLVRPPHNLTIYEALSVRFNGKGILLALMLYLLKIPIDVNKDKLPIKHEVMINIKAQIMQNTNMLNIFNIIDMQLQYVTDHRLTRDALKSSGFQTIDTIVSKMEGIEIDKIKHTLFSVYAKSNGSKVLMEKYINEFFQPKIMQYGGVGESQFTINNGFEIFKSFFKELGGALDVNCYKNDSAHDDMTKVPANEDKGFIDGIEDKIEGAWEQVMLRAGSFYLIDRQTGIIDITDNNEYVIPQELPNWNYVIDAGGWRRAFPIFKNVCDTIGTTKNISNLTDPASTGKGRFYICYEQLGDPSLMQSAADKAKNGANKFIKLLISFMKSIIDKQSDPELDIVRRDDYISHIWNFLDSLEVSEVDDLGNIKVFVMGNAHVPQQADVEYIWDGKQPLMAKYIDGFASNLSNATATNSGATPRSSTSDSSNNLVEGFKAFLNQKIQIEERYYILLITFCRILKFAGDCSHIVCAILLIFIKGTPQPHIILTLDRLLGKNVILAIEHCRKVANNGLTDDGGDDVPSAAAVADSPRRIQSRSRSRSPDRGDDRDPGDTSRSRSRSRSPDRGDYDEAGDTSRSRSRSRSRDRDEAAAAYKIETIKQIAKHVGDKLGVSLACNCEVHSLLKKLPTYLQLQKFQPDEDRYEDRYGEIFVYKYPENPQVVICNKYIEAHKKIAQATAEYKADVVSKLYLDEDLIKLYQIFLTLASDEADKLKEHAMTYLTSNIKLDEDFPIVTDRYPDKVKKAMKFVNNIEKKRMVVKEIMIIRREKDFFDYKYPPPCPTPPCPRPRRNSAQRPPDRVHNLLNIYPFNMKMGKGKLLGNININSSYDDTLKKVFGILFKYHQNLKSGNLLGVYREGTPGETFEERIQDMCKKIIENWLNGDGEVPDINKVANEIIDAFPKPVIEQEDDNIKIKIYSNINSYRTDVVSILREAQKINKLISASAAAAVAASSTAAATSTAVPSFTAAATSSAVPSFTAASSTGAAFGGKRRKTRRKRKKKRKITRRRRYISKNLSRQHKRIKRKFKIHLTRKLKK